jgi:hypothetical protein
MRWWWGRFCTSWIFIVLTHWNNSPWIDTSPHSDTLSWFWANQSLLFLLTTLVIGTSRTVGSAKKFVRITYGFGGGEFTKTLHKVCTCQKLKFTFLLLEYCKSENAMLWRMLSRLETCIVYSSIWSVTLAKSIVPRKSWRKLWHSYISKLFLTKMQVKFSIFFHRGSLNSDSSEVNWSLDKSTNCQFSRFPAWGDRFW